MIDPKVQITVDKELRNRLVAAKQTFHKTWDDFFSFLLNFYIKHSGEDGEAIKDYEYERFYLGDALPDSVSRHHQELFMVLTELEAAFKTTENGKDKAFIGEKIARINAIAKDVATGVEEDRIKQEIAQIKSNRLKILKNIAPSKREMIKNPEKEHEQRKNQEAEEEDKNE
ncbi:MAG: hypothetical protein KAX49_16950 [Halanaerobiales bacterium]|nr:hypothetical protein [Halanaerobiales bacterium]